VSAANNETLPKQLELLNLVVPNLSRVGYLVNPISADPENPYLSNIPPSLGAAAQALKLTIQRAVVLDPSDLESGAESKLNKTKGFCGFCVVSTFVSYFQ